MLCIWVQGCDPGRVSDGSRLALYHTLAIECPSSTFFWYCVFCYRSFFLSFLFYFCGVLLSLKLRRGSFDLFLFSRPRTTGLATTYITGYG